jgi:hypothetical protein
MRNRGAVTILAGLILAVLLAGCGQGDAPPGASLQATTTIPAEDTGPAGYTWNQLLGRDTIRPIYDPEFLSADEVGFDDDELVMGIAIGGEAKAYPVGLLNNREMVNDELAGIPILVTW